MPRPVDLPPLTSLGLRALHGDGAALRDVCHTGALVVSAELLCVDPDVRAVALDAAERTSPGVTAPISTPGEVCPDALRPLHPV